MNKKLLLFMFVLITGFSLQAQVTYYVNAATGNDSNDGSQAKPWATLNPGAWASGTDDCIINIAPGDYFLDAMTRIEVNAQIIGTSKDEVALMGEGDEDFWDDSRGEYPLTGGAFYVPEGSSLTLKNLTLKNQRRANANGGSIKVEWGATLTLENVDLLNSICLAGAGGAVDCDGTLDFKNVLIQGCYAPQSVIGMFTNAARSDDGTVRGKFENSRFVENESLTNGIFNMEANMGIDVSFNNCIFERNKMGGYGAVLRFGVYENMFVKAHVTNSAFLENVGKDACCMAMYTNISRNREIDLYVANCTYYRNVMSGAHSVVFTVNLTANNTMTGSMVFVNNAIINNGKIDGTTEATTIAIPDFTVHTVFINNVMFAERDEQVRSVPVVLWDEMNPAGGAWRTRTILGNFVDNVGGSSNQVAPFRDTEINTMIARQVLDDEGVQVNAKIFETLGIKRGLVYPEGGGVPYFELLEGSPLINNPKSQNEVMINGKNVVPQTDVRGKAIIGTKEVGPFEYDPDGSSIIRPQVINEDILAYPNPFNEILLLKKEVKKVEIFNTTGILCISALNPSKINTSKLSQGIYLVRVTEFDGSVRTIKMKK